MQQWDRAAEFEKLQYLRDRLYAARDRSYDSIRRAEEVRHTARALLDEAHRVLKQTRWTDAQRGSGAVGPGD